MTNEPLNALNGQHEVSTCGCQDFGHHLNHVRLMKCERFCLYNGH